ncbi:MAG: HD-GYP domain-containing protein [Candidatus Brocadiia bacterium]
MDRTHAGKGLEGPPRAGPAEKRGEASRPQSGPGEEGAFFPVSLAVMQPGTLAPVDLFIRERSTGEYVLYKAAHTNLSEETRHRLLARGVAWLHLRRKDEDAYFSYVEDNIAQIVTDELLPRDEACRLVYRTSNRVVSDVFDDPRSGRNLKRAEKMVSATVQAIIREPDALWYMTSMATHDYYTYTHSVNACIFLVAASRDMFGVSEPKRLEEIGLGGVLHDIGKSQIPSEVLSKPGGLTEAEWEQMKRHPVLGLNIVTSFRALPAGAACIIRSHHERLDGTGYPDGMGSERLPWLVRLAGIVDTYDAMTTERAYAPARRPYEALSVMMEQTEGKLDQDMLRSFVRFLGPDG